MSASHKAAESHHAVGAAEFRALQQQLQHSHAEAQALGAHCDKQRKSAGQLERQLSM